MLVDHVDLPSGSSKSVDALVAKSDGPHCLLAIVHFVLSDKPTRRHDGKLRLTRPAHLRRFGRLREAADGGRADNLNHQLTRTTRLFHQCREASGMGLSNSDQTRKGSGCETIYTCCCSRRQR